MISGIVGHHADIGPGQGEDEGLIPAGSGTAEVN